MPCSKCGGFKPPTYSTIQSARFAGEPTAVVNMRRDYYLDVEMRRLQPAEVVEISYGQIAEILSDQPDSLYFDNKAERSVFLQIYPQFSNQDI